MPTSLRYNSVMAAVQDEKDEKVGAREAHTPIYTPEKELFTWNAAERPFKRRDRDFWVTLLSIAAIAGLVLFLVEGVMPVILIISLLFLFYVLSTVEPGQIPYAITNKGVKVAGRLTSWEVVTRFWFSRRFDDSLLIFEILSLPGRLELVVNSKDKEELKKVLGKYAPEEEVPPTNLDKAANWFAKKLPGNSPS